MDIPFLRNRFLEKISLRKELAAYKHAYETTVADRDRLAAELGVYKHAFQSTAEDRDRIARIVEEAGPAQRRVADISLGLLAYSLLREQHVALDAIEQRLARLDESHESWTEPFKKTSDVSLRQRASDGLILLANFIIRENAISDFTLDVVEVALQLDNRFRGIQHALPAYFYARRSMRDYADYLKSGVDAGEWPDADTRHAQQLAVARGIPSVLLVTMPKSGSIFALTTIMRSLDVPQFSIAASPDHAFNEVLLEPLAGIFAKGGLIAQHHLSPSKENIEILKRHNLTRLVLHFRDPRQAAVSWWYYNLKIGGFKKIPKTQKGIEQLIWKHFWVPGAAWLNGWLDLADHDTEFQIHISTQEEMGGNEFDHMTKIMSFLKVPADENKLVVAEKTSAAHFRKGSKDEWLDFFSDSFKRRTLKLLPNELAQRFGWHRVEGKPRASRVSPAKPQ